MFGFTSRDVNIAIRKNFGNRRNFIIWLISLSVVLYFFDNFLDEKLETPIEPVKFHHPTPIEVNKRAVKKRCDLDAPSCPDNSYSFLITSGEGKLYHPAICFNGDFILNIDKNNSRRGINVAVINDKTLDVEDVRIFDTYTSDTFFKTYFSSLIPSNYLVLIASFDDVTYNLSDESRVLLESFGSKLIKLVRFRDSFVMLGQRNLKKGQALEKLHSRGDILEYAGRTELKGCVTVPVGELERGSGTGGSRRERHKQGEALINCGVSGLCDESSFSFHAYTGDGREDMAKLCVNGKYIFAKDLNMAGRGLNVAVVSPITRDVIKIGVFDTYASDGTNAEIFLEMLNDKDIVIVVSFDESSTMLTVNVQKFFEDLGSVMINRLSFRDAWVFVGQKGISGVSPIEKLNRAASHFPEPIDLRMCVPIHMQGIRASRYSEVNSARKRFCEEHNDVMTHSFCSGDNQAKFFEPAPFSHSDNRIHNDIYRTPILIIPDADYRSFQLQMENLLKNPGVRLDMINLIHSSKQPLYTDIAEVYGIRSHSIFTDLDKYADFFIVAFRRAWSMYKSENHLIFLEARVIPTSDFLSFLARCSNHNYYIDNSLLGISTWNPYGGQEALASVWYRSNSVVPGLGFLMKRLFYMNYINDVWDKCCKSRTWLGWRIRKMEDKEMLYPSLSRTYRLPFQAAEGVNDNDTKVAQNLFKDTNCCTNDDFRVEVEFPRAVLGHKYEALLRNLTTTSHQLPETDVNNCIKTGVYAAPVHPSSTSKIDRYSIFFEQEGVGDVRVCLKVASCFGYSPIPAVASTQFRKGVLRLAYKGVEILLIGSKSDYYNFKPVTAPLFTLPPVP